MFQSSTEMMKMSETENLRYYIASKTPPKEACKPFKRAGGFEGTDINAMWRIKQLTELFGPCGIGWYTEVTKREIIPFDVVHQKAFVDINLYVKDPVTGEWSKPIQGTGGNDFVTKRKSGDIVVNDECFKMAETDAIGSACKKLGFGADIYWSQDKTKYTAEENSEDYQVVATAEEVKAENKKRVFEQMGGDPFFSKKTAEPKTESEFVTADQATQRLDAETRAKMKKAAEGRNKIAQFSASNPDCTLIQEAKDCYGDSILNWADGAVLHVLEALEEVGLL